MHYEINKSGKLYNAEIVQKDQDITFIVEDQVLSATVCQPEENFYILNKGNKIYHFFVSSNKDGAVTVISNGKVYNLTVLDPKRRYTKLSPDGQSAIISPMPGRVVRVLAAVGDEVKLGDGIVVVEAMKMQNEMTASKDGIVTQICVTQDQVIAAGETLAIVI